MKIVQVGKLLLTVLVAVVIGVILTGITNMVRPIPDIIVILILVGVTAVIATILGYMTGRNRPSQDKPAKQPD